MAHKIIWKNVTVESLGLFDLTLPVGLVGTGDEPVVSVTALIHGDETTGLLAIHRLIKEYLPRFDFQGTLRLLPVANPLGAFTRTRASYIDMLDMNRGGIGDPNGQLTERLAHAVFEQVRDSDLVINLHEFEADAPLTCVYANSGTQSERQQILTAMLRFGPEVIWSVPYPYDTETTPVLSFDAMVAKSGTPVFSIEFPRGDLVTARLLDAFQAKLINVLEQMNVIKEVGLESPFLHYPQVFQRTPVYTPAMGIWEPKVDLMSSVEPDQVIGEFSSLPDFHAVTLNSPESGTILQIRPPEPVRANSILFALGNPDTELQEFIDGVAASGNSSYTS